MKLWFSLIEEEQSRIARYSTLSLMVIIDLDLLQKDFIRSKELTLMNYSLQLSDMRQYAYF